MPWGTISKCNHEAESKLPGLWCCGIQGWGWRWSTAQVMLQRAAGMGRRREGAGMQAARWGAVSWSIYHSEILLGWRRQWGAFSSGSAGSPNREQSCLVSCTAALPVLPEVFNQPKGSLSHKSDPKVAKFIPTVCLGAACVKVWEPCVQVVPDINTILAPSW